MNAYMDDYKIQLSDIELIQKCVGDDRQAVSQFSDGHPKHPTKPCTVRERGEQKRGEGGKKEKTKGDTGGAALAPSLHRETPQARVQY